MKLIGVEIGIDKGFAERLKTGGFNLFDLNSQYSKESGEASDTISSKFRDIAFKVDISDEAKERYRKNALQKQDRLIFNEPNEIDYAEKFKDLSDTSEIYIGESAYGFSYRLQYGLRGYDPTASVEQASSTLLNHYAEVYSDIVKGYEDGTREIYFADENSETGYRKITMEEELSYLNATFEKKAKGLEDWAKDRPEHLKRTIIWIKQMDALMARGNKGGKSRYSDQLPELEKTLEKLQEEAKRLPKNISDYLVAATKRFVAEFTVKKGVGVDTESLFKNLFA